MTVHRMMFGFAMAGLLGFQADAAPASIEPLELLAKGLLRAGITWARGEPLTVERLDIATLLAEEALRLDSQNGNLWRQALDLALLTENDDLKDRAIRRISQLDPLDEPVRLMRINSVIEATQTVEARIAAYEKLLWEENINQLGPAVASRLALDLALLHRREGDVERFTRRLTQSLELDSANRSAAAIAAGFFRLNVDDPIGEAELLTNLLLADPTNIAAEITLAQLLLEHGAYVGGERMYRLAVRTSEALGQLPSNNLLGDYIVSLWARGNDEAALEALRQRRTDMDKMFRASLKRQDPDLSFRELAARRSPQDPTLASLQAVILHDRQDPQAPAALEAAIQAYEELIQSAKTQLEPPPAEFFARKSLEMAWMTVWLGPDTSRVASYLTAAEEYRPITPEARTRFDGWIAYRQGGLDQAVELLEPLAPSDPIAGLGLALARLEQKETRLAARELLNVHRAQPGSLIGIWAARKLAALLGQHVPLTDHAKQLDALIDSIPPAIDRYPEDASLAVSLHMRPVQVTCRPYEPVLFDIEVVNHSVIPLGLDRDGPIRPQVVIVPSVQSAHAPEVRELRSFVVNIGQRLRLMPRERLVVRIDLRDYPPADALHALALNGMTVKLTALMNFVATPGGTLEPRFLGREIEVPLVRIDGVRVNNDWVGETVLLLQDIGDSNRVRHMALLAHVIALPVEPNAPPDYLQLIESVRMTFNETFARLDGISQAWLLSVVPRGSGRELTGLGPMLSMARKSEDRLVKLVYLLYHLTGSDDPMLAAAKRGEDELLRRFAEHILAAGAQPPEEPPSP